jgi:two-component system sensor histidine kinase KdpD
MSRLEALLTLKQKAGPRWKGYILDSLLALGSIALFTGVIWLFRLYQRIPDSFLVYLLAILSLASLRGPYAALLASFAAFFSFDFFFVPPLYTLSAAKFEDVLTLIVFLVTAVITSQFASMLRQRAEDARRQERETHILYDLVRATNSEEDLDRQLTIFARAVVEVFSPWGVKDCMLLLPDEQGVPVPRTSAGRLKESMKLPPDEQALAQQMVAQGTTGELPVKGCVRMIPLKKDHKVIGVLCLLVEQEGRSGTIDDILSMPHGHPRPEAVFFSTFLEQAVAVIERGHLRQESLRMQVLQQTDALRSALLSSVSHDLRTPLSTIKTAATSLLEQDMQWDEETRRGFTLAIEHEADRLNGLVENLLDMSRIEAGLLHPEKEWYPLDVLLRDVLDRMQPLLEGRAIQVDLPDNLPPVELDAVLIEQVMVNLLTNAATYTPDGSPIDVSVQIGEDAVVVSVADRGPGIAPAEQEHIFDKFYRVLEKTQPSAEPRGSGLGLAICRGLVEAHGGRIWVEAREGGGAIFRFTLPLSNTGELQL